MARPTRVLLWSGGIVFATILLVAIAGFLLAQTRPGHNFALRAALSQADRFVNGELRIARLRSDGLLRGFTLHGVEITDDRGRPFMEADSLRVRYSILGLLRREIALVPAEIWRPRIVLETLHGDDRSNLARIFLAEPDAEVGDEPPSGPGITLELRRIRIEDGSFTLRGPVAPEAPEGMFRTEEVEGFPGTHRIMTFSEIHARIAELELLRPGEGGERARIDELSMVGHVLDEPFVLQEFRGQIHRVGTSLGISADRIWFSRSELSGVIGLEWGDPEGGIILELGLDADPIWLEDFRWLDPRLPEGEGRLTLQVRGPITEGQWRVRALDLEVEGSRIQGEVGFDLGEEFRLAGTRLALDRFQLELLDPWLPEPLPIGGRVSGNLELAGPASAIRLDGRVSYDDPRTGVPASTIEGRGTLHLGEGAPGVTRLVFAIDPLRYPTLAAFLPDLPIAGVGSLRGEATGRLDRGIAVDLELRHRLADGTASRVLAAGTVQEVQGELRLALDATLSPLSLDGIAAALNRELPVGGDVEGNVRLTGPLTDLAIDGRLDTPGGVVVANVRLDALDPLRGYRGELDVTGFRVDHVVREAPSPTILTATARFDGSGGTAETIAGDLTIEIAGSRVGEGRVERASLDVTASAGRLLLRRLEVVSPIATLQGSGDLALREGSEDGRIDIVWEAPDLETLRPFFYPVDETIAADTLTPLERDILRMQGIDPDTLVDRAAVPLGGSARGELRLTGGLPSLRADGWLTLEDGAWDQATLEDGRIDFLGRWEGRDAWDVEGVFDLDRPEWGRWGFQRASGEAVYRPGEGRIRMDLQREEFEAYRLRAGLTHDSAAFVLDLETLDLDLEEVEWRLDGAARLVRTGSRYEVHGFRITRPPEAEGGAVRIEAEGWIDLDGSSDLRVATEGVDVGRLARIVQVETIPDGLLDLDLRVTGPSAAPGIDGTFQMRDFAYGGAVLSEVRGELAYADTRVTTRVEAFLDGRRLLSAEGGFPADLAFQAVEERFPERIVEFDIAVDSLPAAIALAYFDFLEEVDGTLDGEIRLRGSPQDLRPSGELRLREGALSLPEIGLNPTGISADLRLSEDRTLSVSATASARGTARVEGTISLEEPANPVFDLEIFANGFQAVDRRDMSARVGGEITLTGSFTRPRVGGRVRVEQGVLFLEEIARSAEVVDLTDPRIFDDVVDATLFSVRPAVEAAQNPFLQNLRVDVDLSVERDFWLRSRELNVEIEGDLIVTFDRRGREVLLVGGLAATRGAYNAFGRQFQVEGGTVEFQGTPGINPILDIRAVNRLRREGGEPLNIIAQVEGSLLNLRISLSSDSQPPIAQSDLISYLIFGRPSYALASGEASVLQGAAGVGVSAGIGTLASQLGSVFARQFGVDYLAITQTQEGAGITSGSGLGGTFADTQIEVGQYLADNLFLALVLRPLTGLGGGSRTQFPGARLEWRFTDLWTAEAFAEDRFAREGASGFGELGIRFSRVFGISIYREWGY